MSSQSAAAADGKHNEMESESAEEQRAVFLRKNTVDDSEKQQHLPNDRSTGSVGQHQLAVEYHAVGDEYGSLERRRCRKSRADDVITVDSADRLLPPSQSPRSVTAVNAQRRAEFFGLRPLSPDHSEQVMYHLDGATSSVTKAFTCISPLQLPRPSMITSSGKTAFFKLLSEQVMYHLGGTTSSLQTIINPNPLPLSHSLVINSPSVQ